MIMPRFNRSRERRDRGSSKRSSRDSDSRGEKTFEDYSKGKKDFGRRSSGRDRSRRRDSGRSFGRDGNRGRDSGRRPVEMTKVKCSSCGKECEVPFKPTTNKPLFCDECFKTKGRKNTGSGKDLDMINEKLDKIMKALKIE